MLDHKLGGFGKTAKIISPLFTLNWQGASIVDYTNRIVLKQNYHKIVCATELRSWIESMCVAPVAVVRWNLDGKLLDQHAMQVIVQGQRISHHASTWRSCGAQSVAMLFKDPNDVLLFKLSYHEIIEETLVMHENVFQ